MVVKSKYIQYNYVNPFLPIKGIVLTATYCSSSAMQDCSSGYDLSILESVVRRMLLNAQWVTLGGRRHMTCSYPSVPACKVMETAVWCRCQGHYQRNGLPAVAPSHRKLPTHPNKERHKCTCHCLQGERDKMTL